MTPDTPETIIIDDHRTSCDGGGGALGHPKVFLEVGANGIVECGYCGRRFIQRGSLAERALTQLSAETGQ